MNHKDVEDYANAVIACYLPDSPWRFKWINRGTVWGMCSYNDCYISVSRKLFNALINKEDIKQTVLHETAHALVGPGYGHGRVWKNMAQRIGVINPASCADYPIDKSAMGYKYQLVCINKGVVDLHNNFWFRKPRKSLVDCWVGDDKATLNKVFYTNTENVAAYQRNQLTANQLENLSWK